MELNKNKFGLALAGTMGIAYAVCAIFVAFAPELALRFLGWMVHLLNLETVTTVQITFGSFLGGLIPILFYSYLVGWVFSWMYNAFLGKRLA